MLNDMVPAKTTVSGEFDCLLCVQLQRAIRDKRPEPSRSGLSLHQDNAHLHTSQTVKNTMR